MATLLNATAMAFGIAFIVMFISVLLFILYKYWRKRYYYKEIKNEGKNQIIRWRKKNGKDRDRTTRGEPTIPKYDNGFAQHEHLPSEQVESDGETKSSDNDDWGSAIERIKGNKY